MLASVFRRHISAAKNIQRLMIAAQLTQSTFALSTMSAYHIPGSRKYYDQWAAELPSNAEWENDEALVASYAMDNISNHTASLDTKYNSCRYHLKELLRTCMAKYKYFQNIKDGKFDELDFERVADGTLGYEMILIDVNYDDHARAEAIDRLKEMKQYLQKAVSRDYPQFQVEINRIDKVLSKYQRERRVENTEKDFSSLILC